MKYLTDEIYKLVIESVPIFCVDIVLFEKGKILLIKRNNKPMKNKYFTPGGRIYKNETIEQAIKRKGKEELGLEIEKIGIMATYEFFFKDSQIKNTSIHGVGGFYLCKILTKNYKIKLDDYATDYKWEDVYSPNLHPALKSLLDGNLEIRYKEE